MDYKKNKEGIFMNILETKGIYHDFEGLKILFNVNLKIEKGERHAIIGPNGAGKTTLFNLITGTYTPSEGKVFFNDHDISGKGPYEILRLGMGRSFQITNIFNDMTTFENLRLAVLSRKGIRFNVFRKIGKMHEITEETERVLKWVGLDSEGDIRAGNLSYGKQRSLEISLALATDPDLIMLDEPTAGMSKDETRDSVEQIKRLTEGKTVVVIEHDMDVVFSLADRITVLHHGTILASGSPVEIKENRQVKDAYLGALED